MTYGHAERNLALIRQLEAQTRQLLENLEQPDAGHRTGLNRLLYRLALRSSRRMRATVYQTVCVNSA
jgi:hypothetical protein